MEKESTLFIGDHYVSDGSVLELESHFFRELLGRLEDPVFVKNSQHQWIFTNQAFEELVGCSDLIGKTDADFLPPDQVEKFYEGDNQVIRSQTSLTQEEEIGDGCYALVKKIPILLPDASTGLFGIIFDISEYRKVQLEVEKLKIAKVQSQTDSLTGLANRRHLEAFYQQLLLKNSDQADSRAIGLFHIDLDKFKQINDSKGHLHGDKVLTRTAQLLRTELTSDDFIARIGGDEFVAIAVGRNQEQLNSLAESMVQASKEAFNVDDISCTASFSVGLAYDKHGQTELTQLLKYADLALYKAKSRGRARFEIFTPELQQKHNQYLMKRDEFQLGLQRHEFAPHYQAQFKTSSLELDGMEALARWNHPTKGLLLPHSFLELAQSERRSTDLDCEILRSAVSDINSISHLNLNLPALSVNVSPESLTSKKFNNLVSELCPAPISLCFELLESTLLDEPEEIVLNNIAAFRELGLSIDIDDFGSGHTSFLAMLKVKPDRVKIDKRLVIPMTESKKHAQLVKTIIEMTKALDLRSVAEGVESEKHRQMLLELGCDSIQGFGFGKPVPFTEFIEQFKQLNQQSAA